jgi:hypothetical protein
MTKNFQCKTCEQKDWVDRSTIKNHLKHVHDIDPLTQKAEYQLLMHVKEETCSSMRESYKFPDGIEVLCHTEYAHDDKEFLDG